MWYHRQEGHPEELTHAIAFGESVDGAPQFVDLSLRCTRQYVLSERGTIGVWKGHGLHTLVALTLSPICWVKVRRVSMYLVVSTTFFRVAC